MDGPDRIPKENHPTSDAKENCRVMVESAAAGGTHVIVKTSPRMVERVRPTTSAAGCGEGGAAVWSRELLATGDRESVGTVTGDGDAVAFDGDAVVAARDGDAARTSGV